MVCTRTSTNRMLLSRHNHQTKKLWRKKRANVVDFFSALGFTLRIHRSCAQYTQTQTQTQIANTVQYRAKEPNIRRNMMVRHSFDSVQLRFDKRTDNSFAAVCSECSKYTTFFLLICSLFFEFRVNDLCR